MYVSGRGVLCEGRGVLGTYPLSFLLPRACIMSPM